jgi:hypothetical protein
MIILNLSANLYVTVYFIFKAFHGWFTLLSLNEKYT